MAMIKCKLVKLLTKDANGLFVNVETVEIPAQEVVRTEVFVSDATVNTTQQKQTIHQYVYCIYHLLKHLKN